jgi:hypothetical protein
MEYMNWKDLKYAMDPWKKVGNIPLSLLRRILVPHPSRRYKLDQIQVIFALDELQFTAKCSISHCHISESHLAEEKVQGS